MQRLFKTAFITGCIAFSALAAHAQDKIYKKDGTEIDAKVKTVGEKKIVYKRFDNQDGPDYTIVESEIAKIVYPNGKIDLFDSYDKEPANKKDYNKDKTRQKYGKNIFSAIPIAYTAATDGTINDEGIGICYERLLDRHGRIGFNMPVMLSFSSSKDYNNNTVNINNPNVTYGHYTSVYLMPGIKFYPVPDRVKVRYSIGASFFCIFGSEPAAIYDANSVNGYNNPTTGTYRYAIYGLMLTNSVNIAATKHLYMAIDLSAGLPISDNRFIAPVENFGIPEPIMQIGFKVGYIYGK